MTPEEQIFQEGGVAFMPPPIEDDADRDSNAGEFSIENYDDPSANALGNLPVETDEHLPRWAMGGLLPIPLYRQHGNNSFGDFNPKDARGANLVNYNYYPPFTLMPLFGGSFQIPYENKATMSDRQTESAPFDYDTFKNSATDGFSVLTRSPKQCADVLRREFSGSFLTVFDSLTGYHAKDDDKGLAATRTLVDTLLPVRDRSVFPVGEPRLRAGVAFRGPFLDELIDNLQKDGWHRLTAAGYDMSEAGVAPRFYAEMLTFLREARAYANRILNDTEDEIRKPDGLKKGYDPPNLSVADAPVSTDLYCLAHTNRIETSDKQLRASENIGRGIADPLTRAVDKMAEAVNKMGGASAPATVPTEGIMTQEQFEAMWAEREEQLLAKVAAAASTEPNTKKSK